MVRTALIALAFVFVAAGAAGDETDTMPITTRTEPPRPALRVATFNLWHGLDPVGIWRFREYETADERTHRLNLFYERAREIDADVWLLQEVNMLPEKAREIARELDMDVVYQVDNCGLKVFGAGPPVNFQSGQAILARRELGLRKLGGVKLSGDIGWCGDWFAFQLSEFRYALVAEIRLGGRPVLLADVHLHHGPELDDAFEADVRALVEEGHMGTEAAEALRSEIRAATERRMNELAALLDFLTRHGWPDVPVILGGDLNASPDSEPLRWLETLGFASSTGPWDPDLGPYTWDFERNPYTHYSLDFTLPIVVENAAAIRVLQNAFAKTRRLDYILIRHPDDAWRVLSSGLVGREPDDNGVHASDHFGIVADIETLDAQAK